MLFLVFSCQSDAIEPALKGWQESHLALKIQTYESFPVALRFFYQQAEPEKSHAEIRSPLLPGAIIFARAKESGGSAENSSGKALEEAEPSDLRAEGQTLYFSMEVQRVSILFGDKYLDYSMKGDLSLRQQVSGESQFVLERHGQLELGEPEKAEDEISSLASELKLFTKQIFMHRTSKATASSDVLPLLGLDDVLSIYFFPETLDSRQQALLTERQKWELQERFQINFGAPYRWNSYYSAELFPQPHFQELRNSGKLWQQFQEYKDTLQTLYNLQYKSELVISENNTLERKILNKKSK